MKLVTIGDADGLRTLLVERAAAAGVESEARAPERLAEPANVLVLLPGQRQGGGAAPLLRALRDLPAGDAPWKRLVLWGSHRVHPPQVAARLTPFREEDALVGSGRWRAWAELDERVRELGVPETLVFRPAPVAGPRLNLWAALLRQSPLLPIASHPVPLQLLHEDDAAEILWRAVRTGHPGVYGAAADGLVMAPAAARAAGRPALRLPRALGALLLMPGRVIGRPAALRTLLAIGYEPVVIDNARLKTHFGYRPRRGVGRALAEALAAF